MSGLHIIGTGGHAKVAVATARAVGIDVVAAYDDDPGRKGETLLGVPIVGPATQLPEDAPAIIAIGANRVRQKLAAQVRARWQTLVHPTAAVHESARLGPGTVVYAGVVVQPDARIGAHAILNTGCSVDHDCVLEDFVHLGPGVRLCGGVHIGEGTLVGVGACAIPLGKVGRWAVIGAGAAVTADIPDGVTAVGVPARPKR